ncbi:MAG TPA: UvrB/UvrC motif-containing protein [Pirellulaceae bacterium]|nr:UvrB/UvrC motif-containing protein [Pirellulaceae bacterium]
MTSPLAVHHEFEQFGASTLPNELRGELRELTLPSASEDARRAIRSECPASPGVYGWISPDGRLVYIGKSKALRFRLVSYFAKQPADPKMGRIRRHASRLVWETVGDELLALLREQELIHRFRPDFNFQGQPHRRQPGFVAISNSAAPHAFAAKQFRISCQRAFGPIAGMKDLRQAVAVLNHYFRLRDCSDQIRFDFGQQGRLFADERRALCLRFELGSCPAPCAALCHKSEYQSGLQRAVDFLLGTNRSCLTDLKQRMEQAATRREFERAAILRDRLETLARLDRQLARLRKAEQTIHGILPIPFGKRKQLWLLFHRSRFAGYVVEPRTAQQQLNVIKRLTALKDQPPQLPQSSLDVHWQLILASWFRKSPTDLDRIVPFHTAIENGATNLQPLEKDRSLRSAS